MDIAIRKCLSKFDNLKKYRDVIKELFLLSDLNYTNPGFDDWNILIKIFEICGINFLNFLLYPDNDNENSKNFEEIDIIKTDKNKFNTLYYYFWINFMKIKI